MYLYLRHGVLPAPTLKLGKRLVYTVADLPALRRAHRTFSRKYLTVTDAARRLGVTPNRLYRLIARGEVPPPTRRAMHRSHYWPCDLRGVRKALLSIKPRPAGWRPPEGYYSIILAARALGMPVVTLGLWLKKAEIPRPSRRTTNTVHALYSDADLDQIRQIKADYFKARDLKQGDLKQGDLKQGDLKGASTV